MSKGNNFDTIDINHFLENYCNAFNYISRQKYTSVIQKFKKIWKIYIADVSNFLIVPSFAKFVNVETFISFIAKNSLVQ